MSDKPTTACPNCGKENPVGAKFCSGCAASLLPEQGIPTPTPTPPPPSRPGLGGMLGQTGGKVEQRQVTGEPATLYATIERFISEREDSVIKAQYPPQQITAGIVFKDFMTTMNAPVKVDSEISIASAGAGISTVTVGGKTDFGSTTSLWIFSVILFLIGFLFISQLLFLILGVGGTALQIYMLSSRGPRIVADELFDYLNEQGGQATATNTPADPGVEQPSVREGADVVSDNGTAANGTDATLAERIRKLDTLQDQGLISDEEYNARRTEILQEI